jgi:ppGpp synthetase/RelA/SpoT-type nucleotidyltranferase
MSVDYSILDEYVSRHPILVDVANSLQTHLKKITEGLSRIDSISARAKDPKRYFAKAIKTDEQGNLKYASPKYGIQDQIGACINVLYLSDV